MRRPLFHPVDAISVKNKDTYKEHGTSIKAKLGREGMRVIGRAHDTHVIVKVKT